MSKEEEVEDLVEKATQLLRGELWEVYIIIYKLKRIATGE